MSKTSFIVVSILIMVCSVLFLSSCSSGGSEAPDVKPESPVQSPATEATDQKTAEAEAVNQNTAAKTEDQNTAGAEAAEQNAAGAEAVPDSGLTLEKLKAKAEELGYEVTSIEGYQPVDSIKPENGFYVHYSDSNSDAFIPVFEFGSPDDALKYAEGVNSAGYNLCIVNGRFITMAGAQYGIVTNDAQADFLANLLESEVMAAPKIAGSPVIPPAGDYAGACKQIDSIRNVLNTLVNRTVLIHDKSAAEDKNFSAAFISFNMLSSGNLGFTATLSEDEASRDAMAQMWTSFGVTDMKIERTAPHTYELTGTRAGMETPFLIRCMFAPSSGSLRLAEMDGDRAVELFEYVPLGGDTYAFQTINERAVVKYQGGQITDFTFSLLKSGTAAYSPDADGIYDKTGLDAAWVTAAGEDLFEQLVTYDGTILKIYAESFFTGSRITADINVPQNP
ncbi:MAG TPA: hypothetical protein PLG67_09625 [Bacillota bacterium]|nr:hypothetical protein [Bacillota bacterium]HQE65930.1 hypothetical protein [Bacillota bacterium]HQI15820.1 hypothetical protein [Bacillota bacterium]HQJ36893.1 hypothetical protein [Bacillota bacterium]HQL36836.1 hypothetical protein [Bacillota bacterium]